MTRRHFLSTTAASVCSASLTAGAAAKPYRVAVIGHTGRGNFGHGLDTMWLKMPQTQIVAVADADPTGLAAAQKKLSVERGFSDYHAMLKEVQPDIVAIGPRHIDQHHEMCLAAAASGARGIYIEKPLCRSPQEADEIIAACEKNAVKFAIAHRNRYHPALPIAKKLISEGLIGQPLEIRARGKEDARGGPLDLWVLGTHLFNLATYFQGEPRWCSGMIYQDGTPCTKDHVIDGSEGIGALAGNAAHARFEMADGLPLFFDSVQNAGAKETGFGLQIIGNQGVIDLRIDKEPLIFVRQGSPFDPHQPSQPWQIITSAGIQEKEPIAGLGPYLSSHLAAGEDLIAAIEENRAPLCDAVAGRTTIEMVCAVLESHRHGGQRTALPLKTRVNPLTLL
jgi:predicted dehydrogenase